MTKLYFNQVDGQCESFGISHVMIQPFRTPPVFACGAPASDYNWTGNPKPRTQLCPRCARIVKETL